MSDALKTQKLTIFLIKEEFVNDDEILVDKDRFTSSHLNSARGECGQLGTLYIQESISKAPSWWKLFQDYIVEPDFLRVASSSAVFLVRTDSRVFAICFGHGRYMLRQGVYEERFGLKVTLNSIDPGTVRSIDKVSFDSISRQSREQSGHEVTASEFGLNVEQDLLKSVTAKPSNSLLGSRMTGRDSLSVNVKANVEMLPNLLSQYLEKSLDDSYKENFQWVDQIFEVTDALRIKDLNEKLVCFLEHGGDGHAWLALPEIMDWSRVAHFKYSDRKRDDNCYADIHLSTWKNSLNDEAITLDLLKSSRVYCEDDNGQIVKGWSIYKCLYAEMSFEGCVFVLNGGKWYEMDSDFIDSIQEFYDEVPIIDLSLPPYDDFSDKREDVYNQRVANSVNDLVCFDKDLIYMGVNRVEFCDLYSLDKQMIHVKKYGSSSVLSHFFNQGLVSGELFCGYDVFREKVNEKLPVSHRISDVSSRPSFDEYSIIFAIISHSEDSLAFPIFSKISFKHVSHRLSLLGYQVYLSKIPTV